MKLAPLDSPFAVEVTEQAGVVTVAPHGELDLSTAPRLEAAVPPLRPGDRLLLDLRGVGFMDSTGVRLVMALDLRARAEGWHLTLVRACGPVQRVLDLCRIADRVQVVGDPSEAR